MSKRRFEMIQKKKLILEVSFVGVILLLTSFSVFASAEDESKYNQVTIKYTFEMPVIENVDMGSIVYDRVIMEGFPNSNNPGEPCLPVSGAYILIPQGADISEIRVTPEEMVCLGSGFNVEPAGETVFLSEMSSTHMPIPDEEIYGSADMFPGELFTKVGTYSFRGYDILILKLHPVQYVPATGELCFSPDLMVYVETVEDENSNTLFRGLEEDLLEAMDKVDNGAVAHTYTGKIPRFVQSEEYDLLIITSEALMDSFLPLKQAHDAEDLKTLIYTVEDIYSEYSGVDEPEMIRNFIRDTYNNSGIEYVLIGGDDDIVPVRYLYVGYTSPENIPGDLYYACLDGSYNSDGDYRWGEPTDGEDGGDVDLIAEVYVGRACVGTTAEVSHFVNKTLAYMNKDTADEYLKNVWLVGEYLGHGGVAEWGGTILEELINGSDAHGYTTVGIPNEPDKYPVQKLFERDWPGNNWPKSEIISIINDGVHIINHLGHGGIDRFMKVCIPDVGSLTNDRYCFIYSQSCLAGHFDWTDCIAEYLNVKTEHGAFALVMNSREGWGTMYTTDGPSQRYNREFWDAVFGENKSEISRANQDSKEDNIYRINENNQIMRWVFYELNLFGDPTLGFGNLPPEKPQKPEGTESGNYGENYLYTTTTTEPNRNLVFYMWDWGDGSCSEWQGPYNSSEEAIATHRWDEQGTYSVQVKAKDTYGAESEWSDPLSVTMPLNQQSQEEQSLQFQKSSFSHIPNSASIHYMILYIKF